MMPLDLTHKDQVIATGVLRMALTHKLRRRAVNQRNAAHVFVERNAIEFALQFGQSSLRGLRRAAITCKSLGNVLLVVRQDAHCKM